MTKPNSTVIAVVVDRSGSMSSIREATMKGFNEFLEGQKALPGECKLHMVQFDHEYTVTYDMQPIASVSPLNNETYRPRGNTALLDAVGRTITDVGYKLSLMPESERPSRVVFVIQTDGQENASTLFTTRQQIFDMITHQRSVYSWDFIFLGANQDAIQEGMSMGFLRGSSMTYNANNAAVANTYGSLNNVVSTSRVTGSSVKSFTGADRANATVTPDSTTTTTPVTTTTSGSN